MSRVRDIADNNAVFADGISTADIIEDTNLFYTDARVGSYLSTSDYDTATNIVASITDSAPATLDTLNELAAALGDDPNFATTVTNNLATKLPLAGGTMTGRPILSYQNPEIRFEDTDSNNNGEITLDNSSIRIEADPDNNTAQSSVKLMVDGDTKVTVSETGVLDVIAVIRTPQYEIDNINVYTQGRYSDGAGNYSTDTAWNFTATNGRKLFGINEAVGTTQNGFTYGPQEAGTFRSRYFMLFDTTNDDNKVQLTNRAPLGRTEIWSGNTAGGGEVERLRFYGGNGVQPVSFLNSTVGIGTTTPHANLHVQGTTGNNTGTAEINLWVNDDYGRNKFNLVATDDGTTVGKFQITTESTVPSNPELVTILNNGNVGIGMDNPTTKLFVSGTTTLDGIVNFENDVNINTNGFQFIFESDSERDNLYWYRNGTAHWRVIHNTNGDLTFEPDSGNNATGQINFGSTIKVGNSAITASAAGAGAIKYDSVLQVSDGVDWKIVRLAGNDGSTAAKAFADLGEVAGLYSSDTILYTTVQGYEAGALQYTVDFTDPANPKYQATNSNSGVYDTNGTFGGCSQGSGTGWTVWEAAIYCMRGNARLCSLAELDANAVGGTGCSHDNRAVWTYTTDGNGNFYRGAGISSSSLNEGYVAGTNTSPSGYTINEIGIRCCGTGASGGALWEI